MHRALMSALPPLLLMTGLLVGCGGSPLASHPSALDCKAPFPELATTESPATREPTGELPGDGSEPRRVPLAGRLSAEVTGAGWRLFGDETVTVLLHTTDADRPDVLVYAEASAEGEEVRPSEEERRFFLTVDPALLKHDWSWGSAPDAIAAGLPAGSPAERRHLRTLAGMAMTRTGGRGLGYVSDPGTFSGWKWFGGNPQGVSFRLARSHGRWGDQGLLDPALLGPLDRLVQKFPQTDWMKSGLGGGAGHPGARSRPAYMVVGSARSSAGEVHLALLCQLAPACDAASRLADLLSSLRSISSDDLATGEAPSPLEDLQLDDAEILIAPQPGVLPAVPAAR